MKPTFSESQDPGPPANTIQSAPKTQAKFASALDFLEQVKTKFADNPEVYTNFLNIMKDFRANVIDTPGVIGRVMTLFKGHDELIVGFNAFLPPEIRTPKDENEMFGSNGTYSNKMKHNSPDNGNGMEIFPPSPLETKSAEFDQARSYVRRVKDRFSDEPQVYKTFLEILHNYNREQQPIVEVRLRVAKLFKHHPDLLEQFSDFLPDQPLSSPIVAAEREIDVREHSPDIAQKRKILQPRKIKNKVNTPPSLDPPSSPSPPPISAPQMHIDTHTKPSKVVLYADLEKFARIKIYLGQQKWTEFIKCLNLFNKAIITKYEVLLLTKCLLFENSDLWNWLKVFIGMENEEFSEDDLAVGELDLTDCERNGASYRKLPNSFKFKSSSGRTKLSDSVLNDIWISRPTGEEALGPTFKSSSKNEYEELLFKCEDDRFEWDLIAARNTNTIKALVQLHRKIKDLPRAEQNGYKLKPEDLSVLHIGAVKQVYGNKGGDIAKYLMEHPAAVIPIALIRLKQKNLEWFIAKQQWVNKWRRVYQDNYYRSLDHEGVLHKHEQKKKLNPQVMIDDSEKKYSTRKMNCENGLIASSDQDYIATVDESIYQDLRTILRRIAEKALSQNELEKFDSIWSALLDSFLGPCNLSKSVSKLESSDSKCKPIMPNHSSKESSDERVFYGGSPIFLLFRYLQILCVRLSQIKHFSMNPHIPIHYNPPTHLPTTSKEVLTTQEASQERYQHFFENLTKLIHNQLDQSTFEDECRETFGVASYVLYTVDNLMLSLASHLISLLNDELSTKLTDIYFYESKRNFIAEQLYHANVLTLLNSKKKKFRLVFNNKTKVLSISLLDQEWSPPGSILIKKTIITDTNELLNDKSTDTEFTTPASENGVRPDWQRYFYCLVEGYKTSPVGKVYLKRNLQSITKELSDITQNTLSINQLMACIDTQTLKPRYVENTEDLFWRKRTAVNKRKRETKELDNPKRQKQT